MAGLAGIKIAKNISSEIKKAVENGSLSLNVRGTVFAPDMESLNISEPERTCDTGQAYKDGVCGNLRNAYNFDNRYTLNTHTKPQRGKESN